MFLSENLEHSVLPMSEPDTTRFALTIWFNHTYKPPTLPPSDTIFVGIPCYRDPELIPTLHSLITNSSLPLRIGIFLQVSMISEGEKII